MSEAQDVRKLLNDMTTSCRTRHEAHISGLLWQTLQRLETLMPRLRALRDDPQHGNHAYVRRVDRIISESEALCAEIREKGGD